MTSPSVRQGLAGPRRLGWMYILAGVLLASLGGGIATAAFTGYTVGDWREAHHCISGIGLAPDLTEARTFDRAGLRAAADCTADVAFVLGIAQVMGAVALPAAAWVLMIVGGLSTRWRLRRAHTGDIAGSSSAQAAAARFDAWCDTLGLTGRRRPVMVLVPPGFTTTAFTTGLPLGRPVVVVPMGLAFAATDRFDVEVLHEIGHVRAGDVSWASTLWWTGWLGGPALLLALAPMWTRPQAMSFLFGRSFVVIVLLTLVLVLMRAWILRRRELTADRFAVTVLGSSDALSAALGAGSPPTRGLRSIPRRLFSNHPSPTGRMVAIGRTMSRWDGGVVFSVAAGAVPVYLFQQGGVVIDNLGGPGTPGWASVLTPMLAASFVWAAMVVPTWAQRAEATQPAGAAPWWAGPVMGTAAGLPAGYALGLPGQGLAAWPATPGGLDLEIIMLAVTGAGVAALVTAAAALTAGTSGRRRVTLLAATAVAGVVLHLATLHTVRMMSGFVYLSDEFAAARLLRTGVFNLGSAASPERLAAPVVAAAFILAVVVAIGTPGLALRVLRASAPAVVTAVLVCGTIAALSWVARIGPTTPEAVSLRLFAERMWVCALAGWVTATVIVVTGRAVPPRTTQLGERRLAGVPAAQAIGLLTAASTGIFTLAVTTAFGFAVTAGIMLDAVLQPMWLALACSVVTTPVVVCAAHIADRRRRGGAPAAARPWPAVVGSAAATGAVATAVIVGLLAPVTIAKGDFEVALLAVDRLERGPAPREILSDAEAAVGAATPPAHDPGRPLDATLADAAVNAATSLLPAEKRPMPLPEQAVLPGVRPEACDTLFRRNNRSETRMPRTAKAVRGYKFPVPGAFGNVGVSVSVTSYREPPERLMTPDEVTRCPAFSYTDQLDDDGRVTCTVTGETPSDIPHRAYRIHAICAVDQFGRRHHTTTRLDQVLAGHNYITAVVTYAYMPPEPNPDLTAAVHPITTASITTALTTLSQ